MEGMELMVKKIMRDPLFLAQKSVDATEADKQVVTDLLDTLRDNLEHCVGGNGCSRRFREKNDRNLPGSAAL